MMLTEPQQVTPHLNTKQFACSHCGKIYIDSNLLVALENLLEKVPTASSFVINSGYRCPTADRNVGGTGSGPHVAGKAADLRLLSSTGEAFSAKLLSCYAQELKFHGIANINKKYLSIHLDIADRSRPWYGDEATGSTHSVTNDFWSYYHIDRTKVLGDNWSGVSSFEVSDSIALPSYISTSAVSVNPFLATVAESVESFDVAALKRQKVVGLLLYGGCLYDNSHRLKARYRAANIGKQVAIAESASMPYGLYVDIRAHSTSEAERELNQLYYVISKYPPKLGVWVKLSTRKAVAINDGILAAYLRKFEKWGLKGQCGILATKADLSTFSWPKFCNDYVLWLIEHTSNLSNLIEDAKDSTFFATKGA